MTQEKQINLKKSILSLKTALSFILAFLILYYLLNKIDLEKTRNILRGINWSYFLIAFVVFYSSILLRGIRWKILLNNIGLIGRVKTITEILFISWFVNVLVPAKIGDLYRAHLIRRNYGFSTMKSFGSIFTERIIDMLILFILFAFSGLLIFRDKFPDIVINLLFFSFILLLILFIILLTIKKFSNFVLKMMPNRLIVYYERFASGVTESMKHIPLLTILTLLIWFLEILRLYFVVISINVTMSVFLIIFIALSASLLTTVPLTPAGLGAVEFAIVGILLFFNVDNDLAVSVAILDRLISYWSIIPLGIFVYSVSTKC